jgi:putative membrane protein
MMKVIFWIIKLLLFFIALAFAVKNTDLVTVRYYLGVQWQGPLIFVILVTFCLGAVAGVLASLGHIVRLRGEILRLRVQAAVTPLTAGSVAPAVPPRIVDAL